MEQKICVPYDWVWLFLVRLQIKPQKGMLSGLSTRRQLWNQKKPEPEGGLILTPHLLGLLNKYSPWFLPKTWHTQQLSYMMNFYMDLDLYFLLQVYF